MPYWEAGSIDHHSGATHPHSVNVTSVALSSPTVSASYIYNVTDPDNISSDLSGTLLSGSASISTTTWTTPAITGLTAQNVYRVETHISDSSNVHVVALIVECPY